MNNTQSPRGSVTLAQSLWSAGLIAVVLLLALTHILQAHNSFWWDEVYTVANFVKRGPIGAWLAEYNSNNHLLFSILSAVSGGIFGPSEVAYRLPSLVLGIAAYTVLVLQVRRYIGAVEAFATGVLLLCSPLLLYWVPQARGYGVAIFGSVLMLSGCLALQSGGKRAAWIQLAAGGFIGIAALPHFALPFTLTCIAIAVIKRNPRVAGAVWISVGIASLLFYLPGDLTRMVEMSRIPLGSPMGPDDAILGPLRYQIVGTLKGTGDLAQLLPDAWISVAVVVVAFVTVLALVRAHRSGDWGMLLFTLIPIYGTYTIFFALRLTVSDRSMLFLFPQIALVLAFGFGCWAKQASESKPLRWILRAPMLVALPILVILTLRMAFTWSALPIENYREAAAIAGGSTAASVVTDSARALGLSYYLPGIIPLDEQGVFEAICDGSDSTAYVAHDFHRPFEPPLQCLEDRSAVRVDVAQRRRGNMSVWLVPERKRLQNAGG